MKLVSHALKIIVFGILISMVSGLRAEDLVLQTDGLYIKFTDGSHLHRKLMPEGYMAVGIESIDAISANHGAKYFKKLGVDYPDTVSYGLFYRIVFSENKSESELENIKQEYEADSNIEIAFLDYVDEELYWEPYDYFYDFADNLGEFDWPCNGFQDCDVTGHVTNWGDVIVEQWPLHNDGDIWARDNCGYGGVHIPPDQADDINALEAWNDYLFYAEDPNGIPGDPNVIIGHMDRGVDYGNPEIKASLWYNPEEDHGTTGQFDPGMLWEEGGDLGSPTWDDGFPGLPEIDDDGDGQADWQDFGILEIISNSEDNDNDKGLEYPPGYIRKGIEDEPNIDRYEDPNFVYLCDCPHTLIGVTDPNNQDERPFLAIHLGQEGYDDDNDGYIDECDGAMWDDDENGYVDDVIGWHFSPTGVGHNDPTVDGNSHGTQTFGYSAANSQSEPEQGVPRDIYCDPPYGELSNENFGNLRMGMVGVCPDCRIAEFVSPGIEGVLYGHDNDINIFVQAADFSSAYAVDMAYDLGALYILPSGNDWCVRRPEWLLLGDEPRILRVGGTQERGYCKQATPSTAIDISAPAWPLISTRGITSDPNLPEKEWYEASVGLIGPGTSSAIQFVAGAAGLLQSWSNIRRLGWTNVDIMYRLIDGSEKYNQSYHPEYARSGYTGPPEDWRPIGEGRLDVHRAMFMDDPMMDHNCSVMKAFVDTNGIGPGNYDGVPSQDETIGIYFKVFNYSFALELSNWTISSDNPNIQIRTGSVEIPEMPQMDSVDNENLPFEVYIEADAPIGDEISFDLTIEEIGGPSVTLYNALIIPISAKEIYTIQDAYPRSYHPVKCELDNDSYPEIVYAGNSFTRAVNGEDGSLLWSNDNYPYREYLSPSAGDMDGDGLDEIALIIEESENRYVCIIDDDGHTVDIYPVEFPENHFYLQPLVLADWDLNGRLDIIVPVNHLDILILELIEGNLQEIDHIHDNGTRWDVIAGIAVADLNSDNFIDLVLSAYGNPSSMKIFDNASHEFTYRVENTQTSDGPASIADVDDDSQLEIIYICSDNVILLDYSNGVWNPVELFHEPGFQFRNRTTSIGEWDNDGLLEIFFYTFNYSAHLGRLYAYNFDGESITYSVFDDGMFWARDSHIEYSDILVSDLNSDGFADIIFRGEDDQKDVWGLSNEGESIWGEEHTGIFKTDLLIGRTTPIIGDMNLDDEIDIFVYTPYDIENHAFNGTLELFATGATGNQNYEAALQWAQYRHDARRTSLYTQPVSTLNVNQDMTIWDNLIVWEGITVEEDATLTIKPGVSIKMKPGASIEVLGSLVAEGNPSQPISFTGVEQNPGSWVGIRALGSHANVNLKNCVIKHGEFGIVADDAELAVISIDSTKISSINDVGVVAYLSDLSVTNSEITSCKNIGIDVLGGVLNAEGNSIYNTGMYGIRIEDSPGAVGGTSRIIENNIALSDSSQSGTKGIYCNYCELLICNDNNVYGFDQGGIVFSNGLFQAESNVIQNIKFTGITFSDGAYSDVVRFNQISNVEICVYCEGGSYPILGLEDEELWGNNSFEDFGKEGVYNNNYPNPEDILAQRNWWGGPDCPELSTPVVCEPPLQENPFGKTVVDDPALPKVFMLHQNYPNPFNSNTIIRFDLPKKSDVAIRVYNILGQLVTTLVDQDVNAGYQSIVWDGKNSSGKSVASGIYLYNIVAGDYRSSKKMTILK